MSSSVRLHSTFLHGLQCEWPLASTAPHRQRDWVFFLSSWGENWAHVFGRGTAAVGMRGTRQAGGRMGRRPSTVAAAVMRARGFGPRKEGERQAHVTFLPLRETVVEGNFKKWRRSNEGKWDGSIEASALASRISKLPPFSRTCMTCLCAPQPRTAPYLFTGTRAPSPPLTSVTSSERCHCK